MKLSLSWIKDFVNIPEDMDLKQLEYIIAIAEEQSISKAAEKLYVTQSALNQQLLRLER